MRRTRILWSLVSLLLLIGTVAVIRRLTHLTAATASPRFPEAAGIDQGFVQHQLLTVVHILPGLFFLLAGVLQFVPRVRRRWPQLHRRMGWALTGAGLVTGFTALIMSTKMAIGGAVETAATGIFAVYFLLALSNAMLHARRRKFDLHREWMIRAYAIGLAVATIRPIVGMFFAFSPWKPQQFFGYAFWIGFLLHALAAEWWIRSTRSSLKLSLPARELTRGSVSSILPARSR